jgi:Zn-finger protein
LANPNYFDDFCYIPCYVKGDAKRGDFIIDNDDKEGNDEWVCDKVRLGLNLAFIHENVAKDFIFSQPELMKKVSNMKGK